MEKFGSGEVREWRSWGVEELRSEELGSGGVGE